MCRAVFRVYQGGTGFMVCTHHETLRWILTKAKSTMKLAWLCLRLSSFEFYIFRRSVIEHQASDSLLHLKTKSENKTILDDKAPVLTISQKLLHGQGRKNSTSKPLNNLSTRSLFSYRNSVTELASRILKSRKCRRYLNSSRRKTTDTECRATIASLRRRYTSFYVDRDLVLMKVSVIVATSQRAWPASPRPCYLHGDNHSP